MDNLSRELYQMVLDGSITKLKSRLNELPNTTEYLNTLRWYGEEQLSLLMVAALHGHDGIIRLLLTYDPSDEQLKLRGAILNEDQRRINGVSALYCACYREHFHVARTLIELGKADVNETTSDYPRYPLLLHATMNNRLGVVRFLLQNRYADVNNTKSDDQLQCTALLCAALYDLTSLAEYLLDSGADVNYCSPTLHLVARTPVMIAVGNGHLELFVLLCQRGATIDHSLLVLAVRRQSHSIIRYLLDESLIVPDQLELAICWSVSSLSLIEEMPDRAKSLKVALEYRQRTGQRKVCPPPLSIYDNQQECQTVDELESIVGDRDRIFIEFLLLQDRLLPIDQRSARIKLLQEYSLLLIAKKRFDVCWDLCHHLFVLDEQSDRGSSLHRFTWLICEMLSSNHRPPTDRFLQAASLIFRLSHPKSTDKSLSDALLMVILATKVPFSQ